MDNALHQQEPEDGGGEDVEQEHHDQLGDGWERSRTSDNPPVGGHPVLYHPCIEQLAHCGMVLAGVWPDSRRVDWGHGGWSRVFLLDTTIILYMSADLTELNCML